MGWFDLGSARDGKGSVWAGMVGLCLLSAPWRLASRLPPDSAAVQSLVDQGGNLLRRRDPRKARPLLEEAVRRDASSAEAWSLLAAAYSQLGLEEAAIRGYETVLRLQPNSPNALYNLGILHLNRGRFEDAVQSLRAFRRLRPEDGEVILPLAHCLFKLGHTTEGREAIEQALKKAGKSPGVYLKAGQLLLANGLPAEALKPLTKAFELQPDGDECRLALALAKSELGHHGEVVGLLRDHPIPKVPLYSHLLGSSLSRLGRHQEAIPLLEEALRTGTAEKPLYLDLASSYAGSDQTERAMEVLERVLSRWPEDRAIRSSLAQQLLQKGDPREAAALLKGQSNSKPSPEELELLAQCYVALDRLEDAKQVAERAVAEGGARESALLALANILQLEGRDPEAINLLEAHRGEFSGSAPYLMTLGLSYFGNGNYSEANKLFEAATTLDPGLAQAHYLRGSTLASMGKPELAVEHYEAAVRLVPDHFLYHFHLGLTFSVLGKKDRAEEHLKRSVELNGSHAPARYELAKIYSESSRDEMAREQLEEAIRADAEFESSYYFLSQVYARLGRREDAARMMKQFQVVQRRRHEEERAKKLGANSQQP